MIRVNRSRILPPRELTEPNSLGQRERQRVIAFYSFAANRESKYNYQAYRLEGVKKALEGLFHGKCAYCESRYTATQPVDVEHYRPKGEVICSNGQCLKPGYYWLAADWDNLLPCCIDCNRERTQEFPDGNSELAGKACKFPIANEAKRAKQLGQERFEERLLLHPYLDFPDKHLEFTENGNIRPRANSRGDLSRKGKTSIDIYGLRRIGLVRERRDLAIRIRVQMKHVELILYCMNKYPDDPYFEGQLVQALVELKQFSEQDQPYAGMARQFIDAFLQSKGL